MIFREIVHEKCIVMGKHAYIGMMFLLECSSSQCMGRLNQVVFVQAKVASKMQEVRMSEGFG